MEIYLFSYFWCSAGFFETLKFSVKYAQLRMQKLWLKIIFVEKAKSNSLLNSLSLWQLSIGGSQADNKQYTQAVEIYPLCN